MEVVRFTDERDGEPAVRFLERAEVANLSLLQTSVRVLEGKDDSAHPSSIYALRDAGVVDGVLVHTANGRLLWSTIDDALVARAIDAAMRAFANATPPVTSAYGPESIAAPFAQRWASERGLRGGVRMRFRHFEIDRVVVHPPKSEGVMRVARESDADMIASYADAFVTETGLPEEDRVLTRPDRIAARIEAGGFYVWDVGGRIVTTASAAGTPRVRRVGFVYTPPDARKRGFASSLVAQLTQQLLDAGAWRVSLSTDSTYAPSNRIYQAIGYRPVADAIWYAFE
jgi:predicted GNAT family acetyltransferase